MQNFIRDIGLLRALLYIAALVVIILLPSAGVQVDVEWPLILTTVVVPALAPIIFMVILFDLVMSRVIKKGSGGDQPVLLPNIFWIGLGLALIILLRWLPYLLSLSK